MATTKKTKAKGKQEKDDSPSVSEPRAITPAQMREKIYREKLERERKEAKVEMHCGDEYFQSFKSFFAQLRKKHNLRRGVCEAMWLHFKAIGCAHPDRFQEGAENFGFK